MGAIISKRTDSVWQANAAVSPALEAAMLDQAAEFHAVVDEHGQPVWVSESVRSVLGYEPHDYLDLPDRALVHPDDFDRCSRVRRELAGGPGARRRFQFRTRHADGTWRWVENVSTNLIDREGVEGIVSTTRDVTSRSVHPRTRTSSDARDLRPTMSRVGDTGASYGVVGTVEDVTDRRAVDDMLIEGAALGPVAWIVESAAHDLHNLLSSVGMQLALLDRDVGENDRVRAAKEAVDRACDIAEDLMAMSRPGRGKVQPLEIGPLVSGLASNLRVLVDHQADLSFEDRSGGLVAAADRSGLERVVTNLVLNARDAAESRGRIRIEVTAIDIAGTEGAESDPHVAIRVIDNGCGVPAAFADRVFEPHFTTKGDGNGIGLAASRRTVRCWGGDVRFTTDEGRGTTFTVLLPVL